MMVILSLDIRVSHFIFCAVIMGLQAPLATFHFKQHKGTLRLRSFIGCEQWKRG